MSSGQHEQSRRFKSVRLLSVIAGLALIAVAAAAETRVDNTRAGVISEVVFLLGGLAGLVLLFYGLFARPGQSTKLTSQSLITTAPGSKVRSVNDLIVGVAGIVLWVVLLTGLATSGWIVGIALGFIALLPMIIGSVYLSLRFLRGPVRDWRVDLRPIRDVFRPKKGSNS